MTQEEKDLLLKDLCARLPYRVKCRQFKLDSQICTLTADLLDKVDNLEPYLRPMSSMTKEERNDMREVLEWVEAFGERFYDKTPEFYDWLNAHHFDYRGLIEKGLALEAPEGMYN